MLFERCDDTLFSEVFILVKVAKNVGGHMYVKIDKELSEVVILTGHLRIVGIIHTLPQERLTDFMADSTTLYLPVTNASVYNLSDGSLIAKTNFLSLNRNDVGVIIPASEIVE